ncbi:MAG: MCE family protein [Planctomycetes bacterium]|nr:MCE family protein [Planctomycetota bacterium]
MSRNLSRSQATFLGVLVVVTLVLGGSALLALNERAGWGGGSIRVLVGFPDVAGVEVGTRVRVQGIDAGEIEAILAPTKPGDPVKLQLRIAGKYRHLIRDDAKVQLGSDSLLGGRIVRIVPGSPSAKPIEDNGELTADIRPDALELTSQAVAKTTATLAKVDAILDRVNKGEGTLGKLVNDDTLYKETTEAVMLAKASINDVRKGEGALGKVVGEAIAALHDIRRMVDSIRQNSDAIKTLPGVRSYVVDYKKELIRPDCKRYRIWYAESDLFEPGKAVLTAAGKKKLDSAVDWLNKHKYDNSEILVAAFAAPTLAADLADPVTHKQSEVAVDYLRSKNAHSTGWWWWSTRPLRGIGCGNNPTPVPETEKMPPARIEIIVFVPQN